MSPSNPTLDAWEACNKIDTAFVMTCCAFCWPIIPAVGLGYSGYSTRWNSIASFYPALIAVSVCTIQWWAIGYALAYGEGGAVVGPLTTAFHRGVGADPVGTIPAILFSFFQLIFEATVCAIAIGGASHTVWGGGFLAELGVLDFAGGTPVHINSGATATALSLYLSYPVARSRKSANRTPSHLALHKPHNTICQMIALIIIWGSWLAFDAGTTLALNYKSVMAMVVTNVCASAGAITYAVYTWAETGKWAVDSVFLGAIAGLVMITPSAGFIGINTALFFGIFGALLTRQALRIKFTPWARKWRWVDNGDTFATHCLCGFAGTIATGLFASKEVASYDGVTDITGGVVFDGNIRQLGIQVLEACIGFTWSFVVSWLLFALIDCVPGLEVLCTNDELLMGMDAAQMEETLTEHHWTDEAEYKAIDAAKGPISIA
ncbi:hypothetical protein LTR51_007003 [Lithohypha guttulata]|nr:hypothetical protein LTR51_007003 [Lithohypha guttulata]